MGREREGERDLDKTSGLKTVLWSENFGIRDSPTDPAGPVAVRRPAHEKGRQSHSHHIGADKKHAASRRGAGERLAGEGEGRVPMFKQRGPTAGRTASKYFGQHYLTLEKSLPLPPAHQSRGSDGWERGQPAEAAAPLHCPSTSLD